jgi:hypothetical protein
MLEETLEKVIEIYLLLLKERRIRGFKLQFGGGGIL